MMLYLKLYCEFFMTGLFAIGGGMATIPFLYDISDKTGWFTHQDLANMIAVSESTPGPIGVNMASYVGFITGMGEGGLGGAILGSATATLGLTTPSLLIILIVAAMLKSFRDNRYVNQAFYGLRPASTGLIAAAGFTVAMTCLFDTGAQWSLATLNEEGIVLAVILWYLTNRCGKTKKLHPIVFIGISAVIGILFQMG